jgi:hypothetical protein
MIELISGNLIGKGLHRECYVHPANKDLCIKIAVNENIKESQREEKYYGFLEKKSISWEMLPRYYGHVNTNLGTGTVFDMIRNRDGLISKTLDHYFKYSEQTDLHYSGLLQALSLLKVYLLDQQIITMTIKPKNILYREAGPTDSRLVIVDNIGNSDYIPISNHSKILARHKISRKWHRFEQLISEAYGDNQVLKKLMAELNQPDSGR